MKPLLIRLGENHGVAYARNVGLREATAAWWRSSTRRTVATAPFEVITAAFASIRNWTAVVTEEVAFAAVEDQNSWRRWTTRLDVGDAVAAASRGVLAPG